MKTYAFALILLIAHPALAQNRESGLDFERGRSDIRTMEKEPEIQRDLQGRKVIIDADSKIDPGALSIIAAPGSTVVVKARQYDWGAQTIVTPLYKNVEFPK